MIKKLFNKVVSALLPDESQEEQTSFEQKKGVVAPRQRVLNKLKEQFLTEMANETTTESLLYHTSFTVYIRETEYDRLSPSFAQTVRDAINIFIKELRRVVKNYPDYQNHSKYWEMQLVAIPEDSEIDGVSAEILAENPIIIKSKLFADNQYDSRMQDDVRCVTTIHTKDSSKEMPNAFNLASLKGLTELAKDKYRIEFNLNDAVGETPKSEAEKSGNRKNVCATLHIVDGDFILGERKYHVYNMTGDKLLVSGKNGSSSKNADEIHINDESVPNPVLEIIRDKNTGLFSMKVWGDVKIGGKRIEPGSAVTLPHNSSIIINEDYQIDFKTK
ncbi:MAG: hypothetical protein K2G24_01970 [Muribaculaceae bacterium]|nr:hypothetical protein [Muribaculaceae bacterium]